MVVTGCYSCAFCCQSSGKNEMAKEPRKAAVAAFGPICRLPVALVLARLFSFSAAGLESVLVGSGWMRSSGFSLVFVAYLNANISFTLLTHLPEYSLWQSIAET